MRRREARMMDSRGVRWGGGDHLTDWVDRGEGLATPWTVSGSYDSRGKGPPTMWQEVGGAGLWRQEASRLGVEP